VSLIENQPRKSAAACTAFGIRGAAFKLDFLRDRAVMQAKKHDELYSPIGRERKFDERKTWKDAATFPAIWQS
jgi:hypothetical protein